MDYNMPSLNGVDASRLIKQDNKLNHQPSIILVSAHQKDEIFDLDVPETIDGFIHKPVSQSRLFDAIAEAFGEGFFASPSSEALKADDEALLANARILLAEDNIVNQKVAIGILKKKGVEVIVANNGREAIDILGAQAIDYFDLILMDMEMPEIDGYQATRLIREGDDNTTIPIIAMTAHAMQEDRTRCIECGMDGYITKPVAPDLLYKTLASFLRNAQKLKTPQA
jgi:CheY-like chemotaxis protein